MTMPRGASRALYAGNGQAAEFPFFFKVFEPDQLSVLVTSPAGVTSEAAGWTAELDENGGTVRYLHNGAPLPEGWKLAIMRDMPFVQEVDLITGTRFDPEVIETALDVATAERQQLLERLARAVVVEPTAEGGPEALLADIRDARASSAASAVSAQANANAAGNSAQSAAGSAAVATEAREAACVCAGEARDARDVAIAQTEAANTLMEAELAKVNAIVAANRTDQQAAVTAARLWAEKAPDTPVEYDGEGNPLYSARHWAENAQKIAIEPPTAERRGSIRVGEGLHLETGANGETDVLAVDAAEEVWITASGTWTPPARGWAEVEIIDGGWGAAIGYWSTTSAVVLGGFSGRRASFLVRLDPESPVNVTVGAGGAGHVQNNGWGYPAAGGNTRFGGLGTTGRSCSVIGTGWNNITGSTGGTHVVWGGGNKYHGWNSGDVGTRANYDGYDYGAGGTCVWANNGDTRTAGNGQQGAVRVRFRDPAKGVARAATFGVARMASRTAAPRDAAPATVNLYDPETGQGSVWREEDAEAKLAQGLVSEEAWLAIRAQKAAQEREAWLADPDTEAERFALLRAARDARLAATDYLVAPDYPLTDDARAGVITYRQALRDLPAQEGAPWDGGGELTPWPDAPLDEAPEEGDAPCA